MDKIFNQAESNILRKISNSSLPNNNNKEKTSEKRNSSDKSLNLLSKKSSSNLTTSGNKANLTTLTNSNSKKSALERSVTFTETQSINTIHKTNNNNYNPVSSNFKTSFGNFGNNSNSAKTDVKNTIPDRNESNSFFNMSIGFDRMSHATFSSNIAKKIDEKDGAAKVNNPLPLQMNTNANQDYATNRVINTKENIVTDNNLNNEGNCYLED